MISLHGIYEDGKITLLHPLPPIPPSSNVLITFVTDDESSTSLPDLDCQDSNPEKNEEYYQSIREHERVKAHGNITIIDHSDRYTFPLNDYSQGGLSFISDKPFQVGHEISSGITDPMNTDLVLMELKMEVRGIFQSNDGKFKVGCMFLDSVDEDLWHGLLQYLG